MPCHGGKGKLNLPPAVVCEVYCCLMNCCSISSKEEFTTEVCGLEMVGPVVDREA